MSQENIATNDVSESCPLDSVLMKKIGMTRIFNSNGHHLPVTVLAIEEMKIAQVKTVDHDGYSSVKLAYNQKREKLISNPKKGELKKAGLPCTFSNMAEVKVANDLAATLKPGASVELSSIAEGDLINVTGVTKGKGFAGVVKKFGFAGGPMSHGSKFHRTTGSIGNRATPGKVWKGKKMPGHMGVKKQTVKNLEIVKVNTEKGYVLVKGSVPGAKNSFVRVTKV